MNQAVFQYLNNFSGRSQSFDWLVVFCAEYLGYILVAIFLAVLIFSKKTYREKIKIFIFTALSVFVSRIVITEIIRYFYHVSRPFIDNSGAVRQLIFHEASGSFPSGHAAFFFALAMAVYLFFNKKWGWLFFVGATIISISRVVAGIHWPYDILAGAIVGIFFSFAVKKILDKSSIIS